jgi:hypothetical protein
VIKIINDGPALVSTDYWRTEHCARGFAYLSINAGAARLMLPPALHSALADMRSAREVIISRGQLQPPGGRGQDALELMFEDDSDAPFALHMLMSQCDRTLPANDQGGGFDLVVSTEAGEQLRLPARYRVVDVLPYMQPWVVH